jgi:hypothetical protein
MDWNYECNSMKSAYFTWEKNICLAVLSIFICALSLIYPRIACRHHFSALRDVGRAVLKSVVTHMYTSIDLCTQGTLYVTIMYCSDDAL